MKNLKPLFIVPSFVLFGTVAFAQWQENGSSIIYTNDKVGIGTSNPTDQLEVVGNMQISSAPGASGSTIFMGYNATDDYHFFSCVDWDTGGWKNLVFNALGGRVAIGTIDPDPAALLHVDGRIMATSLEQTGGGDLAEPFAFTDEAELKPGYLVAIDPENPGNLKIATRAYDRTVAGIVSGANGINPGLTMAQKGSKVDGSLPVALSGRVYCWAESSNGPIQPGDLLTTAPTAGHAMKVTDQAQAQGAIIGKAMTALPEGKGLVLVLVSLQ